MTIYRYEIESLYQNNQELLQGAVKNAKLNLQHFSQSQVLWVKTEMAVQEVDSLMSHIFDPISQKLIKQNNSSEQNLVIVDVFFKSGVTDSVARSAEKLLRVYTSEKLSITSGHCLRLQGGDLTAQTLSPWIYSEFANQLLHEVNFFRGSETQEIFSKFSSELFKELPMDSQKVHIIDIFSEEVFNLNKKNCWAFSTAEIEEIRNFYRKLGRQPTDVEIEVIAQTWSEHCKHKIFMAEIEYSEKTSANSSTLLQLGPQKIQSLFKDCIKKATEDLKETCPWLVSVFSDNAGVVGWDSQIDLCIKVETHNSPSALDPYGGAITGILGVNRDILGCGLGAKPIANTDVLCFGNLKTPSEEIPVGLKPPLQVMKGVHLGIEHGGNKSGIPTVNGSMHFDSSYLGKPLVYCGTVGTLPKKLEDGRLGTEKKALAGDLIYLVGGGTGKDGIHGATFSSLELHDQIPSHVVQIGDPYTQKCVADFVLKARDLGLYHSITDNGAGGISSSAGEMSQESGGAMIRLEQVALKYPGLSPWEITVSESQERMTIAVPQKNKIAFEKLAHELNVQATCIGEFTDSGFLKIQFQQENIAEIDLHWLHRGTPQMKLKAVFDEDFQKMKLQERMKATPKLKVLSLEKTLETLLGLENISSKENWVRRFDHEVQGATLVKPFAGTTQSAPSDSAVLSLEIHGGAKKTGVAISHGMAPKLSLYDTHLMAQMAVDEALRNLISSGVNLDKICLLDNFCWPDPTQETTDGYHKCAQLVRANKGLYEATQIFKTPLVSGKDSMKNDFRGVLKDGTPQLISVLPTLLVTAMGYIDDLSRSKPSYFHKKSESIFLVGTSSMGLGLSEFSQIYSLEGLHENVASIDLEKNYQTYQQMNVVWDLLQSVHDVSEGGALITLVESCFGENLGAELDIKQFSRDQIFDLCFSEGGGRFIVSIQSKDREQFLEKMKHVELFELGKVTTNAEIKFQSETESFVANVDSLKKIWKGAMEV